MQKIKLTLKWKFTMLTVIIMIATSAILVTTINYDINKTMPQLTQVIIGEVGAGGQTIPYNEPVDSYDTTYFMTNEVQSYGIDENGAILIEAAVGNAVYNIYTTSLITFFIIISLGGICTYFIVNKALKPVTQLNENIKKINEDNLISNLQVKGPHDEIKELTISFNKMMAKLDNAFASQKRFNSSVAHELKTPLAVIKTNIDILNDSDEKTIEEYEETLAIVEKSILKMDVMIETLLDIIRQENAPVNEIISVETIIEEVAEDLSVIAKMNDISLETEIGDIKDRVLGNEILLYRAFYNVVDNAIKYNKPGGTVKILCSQEIDSIKIIISDTGKGMVEKDLDDIFKPFYRCEGINISSNGVGLGLSLAKSAISLHGGEIKVNSELGKGTEFVFVLPVIF